MAGDSGGKKYPVCPRAARPARGKRGLAATFMIVCRFLVLPPDLKKTEAREFARPGLALDRSLHGLPAWG